MGQGRKKPGSKEYSTESKRILEKLLKMEHDLQEKRPLPLAISQPLGLLGKIPSTEQRAQKLDSHTHGKCK